MTVRCSTRNLDAFACGCGRRLVGWGGKVYVHRWRYIARYRRTFLLSSKIWAREMIKFCSGVDLQRLALFCGTDQVAHRFTFSSSPTARSTADSRASNILAALDAAVACPPPKPFLALPENSSHSTFFQEWVCGCEEGRKEDNV